MTSQELLAINKINKDGAGQILSLQTKLTKHLYAGNDSRVRDYVITIRCIWPVMADCPIDIVILKKAAEYLRAKGWKLYLHENHDDRISEYIRRA